MPDTPPLYIISDRHLYLRDFNNLDSEWADQASALIFNDKHEVESIAFALQQKYPQRQIQIIATHCTGGVTAWY